MLQALELVNGDSMAVMLRRGARRLLGQLPPAPAPIFDSHTMRKENKVVDVDLTGVKKLWFLLTDVNSYDPARTVAGWADIELSGPNGTKKLADLPTLGKVEAKPMTSAEVLFPQTIAPGVPSRLVYDIDGMGFTRMHGRVALDDGSVRDDINPSVRFFVFAAEPDPRQLVAVTGDPPLQAVPAPPDPDELIHRLYLQALCRAPSPPELQAARRILAAGGKTTTSGLEDLLWSLMMHPELQYVY